jgi:hypothetical protein
MTQNGTDSDKAEVADSDKKEPDCSEEKTETPISDIKKFEIVRSEPIFALTPSGKKVLTTALVAGGMVFMVGALVALGTLTYRLSTLNVGEEVKFPETMDYNSKAAVTTIMANHYLPKLAAPLLLLIAALVSSGIGYSLFRSAGTTTRQTIPSQDAELLYKLLLDGKEDAIDLYVRLSSLTGLTGTFTQIGLAGLPLATIALTVFFALLSLNGNQQLFDLAKLTLGAFIGSYVQREVTERRIKGEVINRAMKEVARSDKSTAA